jgi:hypothetical protein
MHNESYKAGKQALKIINHKQNHLIMKKYFLLFAIFALILSCSKDEVEINDQADIWNGYQSYKYSEMTVPLMAGQHIDVGTVTYVMTDDAYFEATYTITGGWEMTESHLYAGDYDAMPVNKPGHPKIGKFPFKATHNPPVTTYTYSIPCADLPPGESGFVCAAHCVVNNPNGGDETGWASGNEPFSDKGWGTYTSDFYQNALDIVVLYGIVQNNDDGTLSVLHINGTSHIGEIILTETIATSGTVDAATYDPLTGNLFFVIGNTLYVNNMNSDLPSEIIGTISGTATGGVFLNGNYYYLNTDPNSPDYMEIIEVVLTYDPSAGTWSMTENTDYSSAMPYDMTITDLATDGTNIYLIGINENGTPDDSTDDTINIVIYDVANGSYSGTMLAELVGNGDPQIAFGADGNLYAIDVNEDGETVLKILDPTTGDQIPTDNDDQPVNGGGEDVIDIGPGPMK